MRFLMQYRYLITYEDYFVELWSLLPTPHWTLDYGKVALKSKIWKLFQMFLVRIWTLWLCLGFWAKLIIWKVPACKMKPSSTCILECGTPSWACYSSFVSWSLPGLYLSDLLCSLLSLLLLSRLLPVILHTLTFNIVLIQRWLHYSVLWDNLWCQKT